MTFSDSEFSDIRIALQDRITLVGKAAEANCRATRPYTGMWAAEYGIEIARLTAILEKVSA